MKTSLTVRWITLIGAFALPLATPASAALPVIDIGAIAQMIQQLVTLREQVNTARNQLREAQDQLRALTGGRGQENLLPSEPRNYQPANWQELSEVFDSTSRAYRGLVTAQDALLRSNAVLSPAAVARLPIRQQRALETGRREIALAQSVSRDALTVTSERFNSLGQLIAALAAARDPKTVWDLQTRIAAEQAMLTNEQAKLALIFESQRADQAARRWQRRESALRDVGRYSQLPPLGL